MAKVHSVDYIRAIQQYVRLRTIQDDLSMQAQVHLLYLVTHVRADGSSAVGYKELQRLRLSPNTISKNKKRFLELGIISNVIVGHANQHGKGGKVSRFCFSLDAILARNDSANFPQGEDSEAENDGNQDGNKESADYSQGIDGKQGVLAIPNGSADYSQESADYSQGGEPLSSMDRHPKSIRPENIHPEELRPDRPDRPLPKATADVSDESSQTNGSASSLKCACGQQADQGFTDEVHEVYPDYLSNGGWCRREDCPHSEDAAKNLKLAQEDYANQ